MQINEDSSEGPSVPGRHGILASSGWKVVPRELPHPPPRGHMAPLAGRLRPKGCSCFLVPSSSHLQRPLWPTGALRLGTPGPLPLPAHSALPAAWTLGPECGTGFRALWSQDNRAWWMVLWHPLISFTVCPLLLHSPLPTPTPYVQLFSSSQLLQTHCFYLLIS